MTQKPGMEGETVLRRRPFAVVAIVLSIGFAFAILSGGIGGGFLGVDFGVFYAGGQLIAEDGYSAAYDSAAFSNVLSTEYFPALAESESVSHFISTPTFGWFAQGLTVLPFNMSLLVWFVLGLVALVPACRLLGLPNWTPLVLVVSPMMALNTSLGQTGSFVLLLFVLIHVAHRENHLVLAGVLAGLMILKPTLAVGYGLLWLIQFRRYAISIGVSLAVGAVISIPTVIGGLAPWRGFAEAMQERADLESAWSQQSASVSEFIKLLSPNAASEVTLISWVVGFAVAAGILVAAHRRYGNDPEVMSAAAAIASVVGSPHLLTYDTLILVIPVAVAYRRGLLTGRRAGVLGLIIVAAFVLSPELYSVQFSLASRGIGFEFPALMVCTYFLARWDAEQQDSGSGEVIAFPGAPDVQAAA